MTKPKQPTILFCPLNWGLGHITRDLPLIRAFQAHGHRVVVATESPLTHWLTGELPGLEIAYFPGPKIRYSRFSRQIPALLMQLPRMMMSILYERRRIRQLIKEYRPALIVSDNRYGARSPSTSSVLITHQLMVKLPKYLKLLEWPLHIVIRGLISRFDQCWIPDYPQPYSLAGDLVHKYPLPSNARLIGPLSRFDDEQTNLNQRTPAEENNILAIISGPEPQRTILENGLRKNLQQHHRSGTIITGRPGDIPKEISSTPHQECTILPHLSTQQMAQMLKTHQIIICRSGYSTLMDLHFLRRRAWLIPTPGQTEQEYLARLHHQKGHRLLQQKDLPAQTFFSLEQDSSRPTTPLHPQESFRQILHSILVSPSKTTT